MYKPYYEADGIALYCGKMEEVLPSLPMADCVVTDPPYNETSLTWDKWVQGWPELIAAKLKPSGSMWCFGSMAMFLDWWPEFKAWTRVQERVWEKQNGSSMHTDRFRRVHEFMLQVRLKNSPWGGVFKDEAALQEPAGQRKRIHRQTKPAHWHSIKASTYNSDDNGDRIARSVIYMKNCHMTAINETEKPVGLIRPLLRFSCPPGGLVVDPFAGSCSTLVAARELGMRAIGIERREEQCEKAALRMSQRVLSLTT